MLVARSCSQNEPQNADPPIPRLNKSASSGAVLGRKKRIARRVVNSRMEVETADLFGEVSNLSRMRKLNPTEMDLNHAQDIMSPHRIEEPIAATRRRQTTRLRTPDGRGAYRAGQTARVKTNKSGNTKFIDYTSSRGGLLAPCFVEDEAMRIEPSLKLMYHKGVKEEDNDSDDEIIEAGKSRAMKILSTGLQELKFKRRPSKSPRVSVNLNVDATPTMFSRERTRRNSFNEAG